MMYRYILTILLIIVTESAIAQSDHAEATGYLDYFISTYNTYQTSEQDSALFIKDGAYIGNEKVYLQYHVEVDPKDDFKKEEDFYQFLNETAHHPLEIEAFELQVYAIDYQLSISYHFEDDSYLLIKKYSQLEQEAIYFDKDKKLVKKL
ncbi:hypothetical protein [Flammeovirga aprica]|uniref:Uncharacterized protein n=1 Tax=Flammeovirga aprica JL-4 TaxID=694437 RepID=A0A7X9P1U7_9BACT|nr:hypothetical protein [Flammeovirga aprica]NME68001.1 hypothetical protein [Flammeovirga aprica JL-4]